MYHWHGSVADARPEKISRDSFHDTPPPLQDSRSKKSLTQYLRKGSAYTVLGCLVGVCGAAALGYVSISLGIAAGVALFVGALTSWGLYVLDCEILH